jgi:hypothetical protein
VGHREIHTRSQTIISAIASRTGAFAIILITFGILTAGKSRKEAIKTGYYQYISSLRMGIKRRTMEDNHLVGHPSKTTARASYR